MKTPKDQFSCKFTALRFPSRHHLANTTAMAKEPPAPATPLRNIEVRTWFIEPVFSPDLEVDTGLVRIWGMSKDWSEKTRWWRSSSIHQRVSSTTLQTRFGTVVKLKGAICKKYARKLKMSAEAIQRFQKGFPATWKKLLESAFSADVLKERSVELRRSPRRNPPSDEKIARDEEGKAKRRIVVRKELRKGDAVAISSTGKKGGTVISKRNKSEVTRRKTRSSAESSSKEQQPVRRSKRVEASVAQKPSRARSSAENSSKEQEPARRSKRVEASTAQKPKQARSGSDSSSKEQHLARKRKKVETSSAQKPLEPRRSRRTAVKQVEEQKAVDDDIATETQPETKSESVQLPKKRRRSGGLSRPGVVLEDEQKTLAEKLKSVQDAKKARRARRVAFATAESEEKKPHPANPETDAVKPGEQGNVWTEEQRTAFERQRNSVPADNSDYWETIAAGVEGKTAEQCRALWEASWASPRVKTSKMMSTPGKKLKQQPTGQMVAELQKAARRARSRNTGKFRQQTRELAERYAQGTQDELLEPLMPGAEATKDVDVTPKMSMTAGLAWGTPGTEVRALRERNDQAGNLVTPEILARGKGFGLDEADQYVALFKRRMAGRRSAEGVEEKVEIGREEEVEEDVGRIRRRIGGDDGSEYSDESDGSSPFF